MIRRILPLAAGALALGAAPALGAVTFQVATVTVQDPAPPGGAVPPPRPATQVTMTGDGAANRVTVTGIDGRVRAVGFAFALSEVVAAPPAPCGRTVDGTVQEVTCVLADAPGRVIVDGGAGDDRITLQSSVGVFSAEVFGGPGVDSLFGGDGPDVLDGGADGDGILGGGGDDVIRGDGDSPAAVQGNDNMAGGAGDDVLDGGGNGDLMLGGTGRDLLRYDASARTEGVVVTLDGLCNDGSPADVFAPPPPLQGLGFRDPETGLQVRCAANGADRDNAAPDIEQVTGTAFADDITGTGADELLVGGPGNDELEGAGGVDQLFGRGGSDTLLARDERADATISCDGDVVPTGPGGADRAVVDAVDPVEPDCETVERGGAGREGPIGGGLPPVAFPPGPPAPPSQVLVPPPPPFIAVPPQIRPSDQGAGRGAGGGDGRRAPQLRITSPVATIQRDGVATFRARCVYRAAQCVGRATLTLARRTPARVGGRRVVLPAGRRLASAPVRIPWGTSRPVRMRVGGLTITGPGAIRARLEVRARDSGFPRGPEARAVRAVLLGARR